MPGKNDIYEKFSKMTPNEIRQELQAMNESERTKVIEECTQQTKYYSDMATYFAGEEKGDRYARLVNQYEAILGKMKQDSKSTKEQTPKQNTVAEEKKDTPYLDKYLVEQGTEEATIRNKYGDRTPEELRLILEGKSVEERHKIKEALSETPVKTEQEAIRKEFSEMNAFSRKARLQSMSAEERQEVREAFASQLGYLNDQYTYYSDSNGKLGDQYYSQLSLYEDIVASIDKVSMPTSKQDEIDQVTESIYQQRKQEFEEVSAFKRLMGKMQQPTMEQAKAEVSEVINSVEAPATSLENSPAGKTR